MIFYKGFSTIDKTRRWTLTDTALVKRDLLNHFHTRKGERVMNPKFGSIIWDILFDGLTEDSRALIIEDSTNIIKAELRVQLLEMAVNDYEHGIQLNFRLKFLPQNNVERMYLNYNKEINKMSSF